MTAITGSPRGRGGLLFADFFLLDGKIEQLDERKSPYRPWEPLKQGQLPPKTIDDEMS